MKKHLGLVFVASAALLLAGCADDTTPVEYNEPASGHTPVADEPKSPLNDWVEVYEMPDNGLGSASTKLMIRCHGTTLVYSTTQFRSDMYDISVIPNSPDCQPSPQ